MTCPVALGPTPAPHGPGPALPVPQPAAGHRVWLQDHWTSPFSLKPGEPHSLVLAKKRQVMRRS